MKHKTTFYGRRSWCQGLFLVLLLWGTSACDDAFEPFSEDDAARPVGIYGFLDMRTDTQFVRVVPTFIRALPDLSVRTTNRTTGDLIEWERKRVILDDSTEGLLFQAVFEVKAGNSYVLDVLDQGRETIATASIHVPETPQLVVSPVSGQFLLRQSLTVRGALRPNHASVRYRVTSPSDDVSQVIAIDDVPFRASGGSDNWSVVMPLTEHRDVILFQLTGSVEATPLVFEGVELRLETLTRGWEQQASLSQGIERNAYGFWDVVASYTLTWELQDDILHQLGFLTSQ